MPKKLYVSGVPGSGVGLVCQLFHAFEGVCFIDHDGEQTYLDAINSSVSGVWRSLGEGLFSQHSDDMECAPEYQLEELIGADVSVIYVRRNLESLVLLDGDGDLERRHYSAEGLAEKMFDRISLVVDIEDIMEFPDEEQRRFAEVLGLRVASLWSGYPGFVPVRHRPLPLHLPQI